MDILYEACRVLKQVLQARAPYDTGHLAMDSIRIVGNSVVVGGEEIAPYALHTNEPWTSEKWHGAKNPNEGWVQKAIEEALPLIQRVLSGRATDEDVQRALTEYKGIYEARKQQRITNLRKKFGTT